MFEFLKAIGPYLGSAVGGGFIGSGVMAYLNARLEREKAKTERRRKLVDLWRSELFENLETNGFGAGVNGWKYSFELKPAFTSLLPLTSDKFRSQLKTPFEMVKGQSVATFNAEARTLLAEEIGRIEREWKLI